MLHWPHGFLAFALSIEMRWSGWPGLVLTTYPHARHRHHLQVEDTPIEINYQMDTRFDSKRVDLVTRVCLPLLNGTITLAKAKSQLAVLDIDSCPTQPGYDNIFNYMWVLAVVGCC